MAERPRRHCKATRVLCFSREANNRVASNSYEITSRCRQTRPRVWSDGLPVWGDGCAFRCTRRCAFTTRSTCVFCKKKMPTRDRKKKRHKRRRAVWKQARRKRRRTRRNRDLDTDLLLLQLVRQLQGQTIYARPPVDPYTRGGNVPPLRSSHRVALDEYRQATVPRPVMPPGPPPEFR